jgi:hypothetical protein
MHALTMPMTVPLSVGKFLVQVMSAVVSMKVPAKGATIEMPMTCQYDGWIHLHGNHLSGTYQPTISFHRSTWQVAAAN